MKRIEKFLINGKFVSPASTEEHEVYNPSLGKAIGKVVLGNEQDIDLAVQAAKAAFVHFSKSSLQERCEILERLHREVTRREEELNLAAVEEYGSPISATEARTKMAAQSFLAAREALQEIDFVEDSEHASIYKVPLGVVGAITPWNANYIHICTKIAPAIAAGCTVVVKPSEYSALETQLLAECFMAADLPPGLINIVNGTGAVAGAALVSHPDVALISFTGSTQTGKWISKAASDTMKRAVLELGGKSPNILLDDADLEKAVPLAVQIAFSNSGQACHAGTRLIVPEQKLEQIKVLLAEAVGKIKIGQLMDRDAAMGPMVSAPQFEKVQAYIQKGLDEGAVLLAGGLGNPEGLSGWYARPTVFADVREEMAIAREEIFGPVLCVLTYKSLQEAIDIANNTIYGLSAYVSSADLDRARAVASQIISGRVIINQLLNLEPKSPFGGFKQSGIGRSGWTYGIESHLEPKVIAF